MKNALCFSLLTLLSVCSMGGCTQATIQGQPFTFGSGLDDLAPGLSLAEVTNLLGVPSGHTTADKIDRHWIEYRSGPFAGVEVAFQLSGEEVLGLTNVVISGVPARMFESGVALGMQPSEIRGVVGEPEMIARGSDWTWESYSNETFDIRVEYDQDQQFRRLYMVPRRG